MPDRVAHAYNGRMKSLQRHLFKCMMAGIAALLPLGGTVLMVLYFEKQLAGSWLESQPFYRFGLGIVLALLIVYVVGLLFSSFLGRWLWAQVDMLVMNVPLLGSLYQTIKQLLGYGDGPDAMFKRVVLLPCEDVAGEQVGFVTAEIPTEDSGTTLAVFMPAAPNPSNGRLIYIAEEETRALAVPVNEAMKALISVGSLPLTCKPDEAQVTT